MSSIFGTQLTPEELQLLSNYPALQPPDGVMSNFTNPPNHGKAQIVWISVLLCITTMFVLNRVYIKTFIVRKYMLNDLTIIVGMIGTVAYYAATVFGVQRGRIGVHEWNINIPQTASKDLQIPIYIISVINAPTFLFIKLTFFLTYRQIFGPMRWMGISALLGAIFTTLYYIVITVCYFVFATPRRGGTWLSFSREKFVIHFSIPQSAVGLVIDLYILILPIVAVSRLQMATRRKVGIILIFTTGLFACLGSILSIYYRIQLNRTKDYTWAFITVNIVTLLEMLVGIICACMPAAAHTFRHHLPSYDSVRNTVCSHYDSLEKKIRRTNPTSSSAPESKSLGVETPRGIYEGYFSLGGLEHDLPVPAKPLQTFTHDGRPDDLKYDGINVTYEMQLSSGSPSPRYRGWTAV